MISKRERRTGVERGEGDAGRECRIIGRVRLVRIYCIFKIIISSILLHFKTKTNSK